MGWEDIFIRINVSIIQCTNELHDPFPKNDGKGGNTYQKYMGDETRKRFQATEHDLTGGNGHDTIIDYTKKAYTSTNEVYV